jgi:hypothetical protein
VVERDLAKVDVAGPTPVSRSCSESDSVHSESLFFSFCENITQLKDDIFHKQPYNR